MGQPDILAIFTPQAPVEQAVTPPRYDIREDDGFQRIMDDASHRVSPANENNKPDTDRQDHSPAQKPSEKKPIEKSKPKESQQKDQTNSKEIDPNTTEEPLSEIEATSAESENIAPQELASVDNFQEAMDYLKELGFDVQTMETLLEIFNNDSGLDVGALLQSLTAQNSKLKDFSFQDYLSTNSLNENSFSQLENRKSLINDLLKQAGFNDKEVKNFIQKFESQQNNKSNLNGESAKQDLGTADKINKPEVASQASKDLVNIETGTKKKEETTVKKSEIKNMFNPDGNKHLDDGASKRDEKVSSTGDNVKVESKDIRQEKTISQSTIGMKYADATSDATKSKNLEAIKANGEVQVLNNNVAGGGSNKSILNTKAAISESAIYKAPIESRVIDQIINRLSIRSNGSQSEVKIQLDPPSLGRVRMNIITSGDGVRTLIVAENQAVKQVIESNLSQLRDSMLSQGLKLDGFSVLVGGDSNPEFSQQRDNSGQPDTNNFDHTNPEDLEIEASQVSTRQTSFIFDDISQTVSVMA